MITLAWKAKAANLSPRRSTQVAAATWRCVVERVKGNRTLIVSSGSPEVRFWANCGHARRPNPLPSAALTRSAAELKTLSVSLRC